MSLVQPTAGELLDRRSILALKIRANAVAKDFVQRCQLEQEEIDKRLKEKITLLGHSPARAVDSVVLDAINKMLWRAENEVRSLSPWRVFRLAKIAKTIARLNDLRSSQIQRLNERFGDVLEPKIYARPDSARVV